MLMQELKTVYNYNLNIKPLKIEIDGKLIPIQEYALQDITPEKIDPKIHLLPSDEKRNTPQMRRRQTRLPRPPQTDPLH